MPPDADDRGHLIREDRRQRRQVADAVVARAKKVADRRLALGHAVEVAHVAQLGAQGNACRKPAESARP